MAWTERKLTKVFGVELTGQNIGPALPVAERRAVYDLVTRYGVVVIPGQDLSDEDIDDFASSLGAPIKIAMAPGAEPVAVRPFGNIDKDGKILPTDDLSQRNSRANFMWHIDSTYQRPRATISMLYGITIPPEGGDTEFCDMRRAWELLTPDEQEHLEGLAADHSLMHSRAMTGFSDWPKGYDDLLQSIARPLVQAHADTGRKALLLASHIAELTGYDKEESVELVAKLVARAATPENCYAHRWRKGDFLMWDNRCVMHRARPFPAETLVREMRTVRLMHEADA